MEILSRFLNRVKAFLDHAEARGLARANWRCERCKIGSEGPHPHGEKDEHDPYAAPPIVRPLGKGSSR